MPKISETRREERRAHILACAEEVFLRLGYRRARLQDVMDAAGVSRGGLYDYFESKRDLFRAVVAQRDQESLARLDDLARGDEAVTPFVLSWTGSDDVPDERAMRWVTALVEYNLEERGEPDCRQSIGNRFERYLAALTAVLEAGVRRGEFEPVLPCETIARFLIVAQDGAAMGRMVLGDAFRADEAYGQALSHFTRTSLGMRRRAEGNARRLRQRG